MIFVFFFLLPYLSTCLSNTVVPLFSKIFLLPWNPDFPLSKPKLPITLTLTFKSLCLRNGLRDVGHYHIILISLYMFCPAILLGLISCTLIHFITWITLFFISWTLSYSRSPPALLQYNLYLYYFLFLSFFFSFFFFFIIIISFFFILFYFSFTSCSNRWEVSYPVSCMYGQRHCLQGPLSSARECWSAQWNFSP